MLEAMLLLCYGGRAFARSPAIAPVALARVAQAHEVLIWASRFCPHCLREHGAWLLRWQLGWSVVCVRHSVVLVRCCPRCGSGPLIGTRAQWPRDQAGELSDPSRCTRRHGRELCRASLTAATAVSVAGDTALLAAQQRLDALLDGDAAFGCPTIQARSPLASGPLRACSSSSSAAPIASKSSPGGSSGSRTSAPSTI